ncbi:Aspartate aminotransferase [Forsythia ovata]|uniref:Aspartate aminotransferase n=1 Tax=Forsythia ovata TaxID=205694 RepID=A0ABD1UW59_9LAMI
MALREVSSLWVSKSSSLSCVVSCLANVDAASQWVCGSDPKIQSGSIHVDFVVEACGPAPKDLILGVIEAFLTDPSPDKVNVRVSSLHRSPFPSLQPALHPPQSSPTENGAYRDDNGKPMVLECVRESKWRIAVVPLELRIQPPDCSNLSSFHSCSIGA